MHGVAMRVSDTVGREKDAVSTVETRREAEGNDHAVARTP